MHVSKSISQLREFQIDSFVCIKNFPEVLLGRSDFF